MVANRHHGIPKPRLHRSCFQTQHPNLACHHNDRRGLYRHPGWLLEPLCDTSRDFLGVRLPGDWHHCSRNDGRQPSSAKTIRTVGNDFDRGSVLCHSEHRRFYYNDSNRLFRDFLDGLLGHVWRSRSRAGRDPNAYHSEFHKTRRPWNRRIGNLDWLRQSTTRLDHCAMRSVYIIKGRVKARPFRKLKRR